MAADAVEPNPLSPTGAVTSATRQELPGGTRVLVEPTPGLRSVSIGAWVTVGARDEAPEIAGASHFLEHLLFKGTGTRSSRDISEAIDGVGGDFNAFTAKESTAFYVRVPADHAAMALDVLLDVITDPRLDATDVESERQVIREELLQCADDPDELVHDLVLDGLFPGHPLGREILGDRSTIEALGASDLESFFERHYGTTTLVMAVAGAVEPADVAERVAAGLPARVGGTVPRPPPSPGVARVRVDRRATEQVHLVLGWRALPDDHPDRHALAVLNHVLGGGVASRLFEEVREQRSLAYSVYSYVAAWSDAGMLGIYAGTAPARAAETAAVVQQTAAEVAEAGITERELALAVGHIEGSLALSLEHTSSRMSHLAHSELAHGRVVPLEEELAAYRAVSLSDIHRVAHEVMAPEPAVAAVGPVGDEEVRAWLE